MIDVPLWMQAFSLRDSLKAREFTPLSAPEAAMRRAVAQFNGLLRAGSNRKMPLNRNRLPVRKTFFLKDLAFERSRGLDLAGGTPLIIRHLIVPLTMAAIAATAAPANAQGAFPAPLPGQQAASPFPPVNGAAPNSSPFPPVNGAAPAASLGQPSAFPSSGAAPIAGGGVAAAPMGPSPQAGGGGPSEACMKGFVPLREDAEKRGKLIKAAGERKAQPEEACKLIGDYSRAETKMIEYVRLNSAKCQIPPQIHEQLKKGHVNTEVMLKKVCAAAQAGTQGPAAGPSLSEVLGTAAVLPEATAAKKGGSTFDTLNGNVLAR